MFHTTDEDRLVGNPIDDVIGSVIKYSAITAAAELRVFEALTDGPSTASELASRLAVDETGIAILADVLSTLGYLERDVLGYRLGPVARRWLDRHGERDFTPALRWGYELTNVMWDLPAAIRHGAPPQQLWDRWRDKPNAGADFANYMKIKSTLTVEPIVAAAPVPGSARRLLDLGGSHGLHSMEFVRRHPQLHATVMDLPEALSGTMTSVEAAGLADRVTTRAGDFLHEDLGSDWDVVLLFEIVHNHTAAENADLIARAAQALSPGGRILVLEDVATDELDAHNCAFSLAMYACSGDRTYRYDEIAQWFAAAGLTGTEQIALPSSVSLVTATKSRT